jgi:tRNA_anti-like
MNKKIKLYAIGSFALIALMFGVYKFLLKNAERDIKNENAVFTVNSRSISDEFGKNATTSITKYQDKTIVLKGIVTDVSDKQLILDGIMICEMIEKQNNELRNKKVTLKGRFVGYDDLMGELKMDQCSLKK